MSDENKEAEYRRTLGVKENYVHERAHYDGLCKAAIRRTRSKRRIVMRRGDTPDGAGKTVTVSQAQFEAYTIISEFLKTSTKDSIQVTHLRKLGIRKATLKALVKSCLIRIKNESVSLWRKEPTDQEVMASGGVGKIVISMGVK
jgi:hypothetical protein